MAMILGYWDIRGVSEGSVQTGRMDAGGRKNVPLGDHSTRRVLLGAGWSAAPLCLLPYCRQPVSERLQVCAVCARCARGVGGCGAHPQQRSQSRSQDPPSLTTVATLSPSWLTPSACSWSTRTPTTRRRSTRWGTVMASPSCVDLGPTPADLVPGACALATCRSPLLPLPEPL